MKHPWSAEKVRHIAQLDAAEITDREFIASYLRFCRRINTLWNMAETHSWAFRIHSKPYYQAAKELDKLKDSPLWKPFCRANEISPDSFTGDWLS